MGKEGSGRPLLGYVLCGCMAESLLLVSSDRTKIFLTLVRKSRIGPVYGIDIPSNSLMSIA